MLQRQISPVSSVAFSPEWPRIVSGILMARSKRECCPRGTWLLRKLRSSNQHKTDCVIRRSG